MANEENTKTILAHKREFITGAYLHAGVDPYFIGEDVIEDICDRVKRSVPSYYAVYRKLTDGSVSESKIVGMLADYILTEEEQMCNLIAEYYSEEKLGDPFLMDEYMEKLLTLAARSSSAYMLDQRRKRYEMVEMLIRAMYLIYGEELYGLMEEYVFCQTNSRVCALMQLIYDWQRQGMTIMLMKPLLKKVNRIFETVPSDDGL